MTHTSHPAATASAPHPTDRALVLGGGGSAGNAWLIGVIAGLAEGGLDATAADLIVGTSAGATAAAQITSAPPAELIAEILAAPAPARPAGGGPGGPAARGSGVSAGPRLGMDHLARVRAVIAASDDLADMRRRMSDALEETTDPEASRSWRAIVAQRFRGHDWPARRLLITAVDARTAEPALLDRESGVDLVDAVAASCAGGFVYRVGDDRYIDGGYRLNADNADLAAGHGRVLVLSPLGGRALTPVEWGTHLPAQIATLRAGGSAVETVLPDAASLAVFGDNMMNPATRVPAARAGHAQGLALAGTLAEFWG